MANLKNINFMSGTQFTNLETTKEDELYAVNIENDATFKSFVSGMGMPSSKSVNLTLGDSDSNYTAPANGYIYLRKAAVSANQTIQIGTNVLISFQKAVQAGDWLAIWVPISKGKTATLSYTASGETKAFKFVYAEGENN